MYLSKDANGFSLMGPPAFPQFVFVESGRIDACMQYALENKFAGVAISPLGGYQLPDLSFLDEYRSIKRIAILHAENLDISAILNLKQLVYLQISGRAKQPVDLSKFPILEELRIQWWPGLKFGTVPPPLRILSISHYKPVSANLSDLPAMPTLIELNLVQGRKLVLVGVDRFPNLQRLTCSYLPSLNDISPLMPFSSGNLQSLEFDHCSAIRNHEVVSHIKSLKRLAFNSCGEVRSLAFLNDLPELESFSFVDTNVVDGDLSPCLRLKFVGFLDRRHYSHRKSDFGQAGA